MIPRLREQRETKVTVTGQATFCCVCEYMQIGVNEIHPCMIYELLQAAYLHVTKRLPVRNAWYSLSLVFFKQACS